MPGFMLSRRRSTDGATLVEIEVIAHDAGLHPDLVRRLISLGAVEPDGALFHRREAAARLARISRLRRDLGLNYAGAVLAVDLLTRIELLEARLRRYEPPSHNGR
jgi:hypothetical protein